MHIVLRNSSPNFEIAYALVKTLIGFANLYQFLNYTRKETVKLSEGLTILQAKISSINFHYCETRKSLNIFFLILCEKKNNRNVKYY